MKIRYRGQVSDVQPISGAPRMLLLNAINLPLFYESKGYDRDHYLTTSKCENRCDVGDLGAVVTGDRFNGARMFSVGGFVCLATVGLKSQFYDNVWC